MLATIRKQLNRSGVFGNSSFLINSIFSTQNAICTQQKAKGEGPEKSKTVEKKVFITLIGPDGYTKTSTLEAAEKISLKKGLTLMKVRNFDPRRRTPVYKLMSDSIVKGKVMKVGNSSEKSVFKREKSIHLSCSIADHDLHFKLQQVVKWLMKRHAVSAMFSGSPSEKLAETIISKTGQAIRNNGKIVQKTIEKGVLKMQMIPLVGEDGNQADENEKKTS